MSLELTERSYDDWFTLFCIYNDRELIMVRDVAAEILEGLEDAAAYLDGRPNGVLVTDVIVKVVSDSELLTIQDSRLGHHLCRSRDPV